MKYSGREAENRTPCLPTDWATCVIIYYLSSVIYYLFLLTSYLLHLHSTAITESVLAYLGAVLGYLGSLLAVFLDLFAKDLTSLTYSSHIAVRQNVTI